MVVYRFVEKNLARDADRDSGEEGLDVAAGIVVGRYEGPGHTAITLGGDMDARVVFFPTDVRRVVEWSTIAQDRSGRSARLAPMCLCADK
jgi:hypothetical protein